METFSALLSICAGNSPVPVNSPQKGQRRGALMFSLICARINGWVNNREAGDLRCHRAHYDVIVMTKMICTHDGNFPQWVVRYWTVVTLNVFGETYFHYLYFLNIIMTSSIGHIFRITGPLWEESTRHRWIPLTKASEEELWCFLYLPEQTVEQTIGTQVIWDAIALIMMSL